MKKLKVVVLLVLLFALTPLYRSYAATKTADEYFNEANKYTVNQPYEALSVFVEANKAYPQDQRFIDGINNRSKTILEWSIGSHNAKHFDSAIYGYDTVLKVDVLKDNIKSFTTKQKQLAASQKMPTQLKEYQDSAAKYDADHPYEAFSILNEALVGYPYDQYLNSSINSRARTILEWSIGSHRAAHFDSAIYGYNVILSGTNISDDIKSKANFYLSYAKRSKIYYTADEYNSKASSLVASQPYDALKLYTDANTDYPNDTRFIKGINASVDIILDWSRGSHQSQHFASAIYGYDTVSNVALISKSKKSYAKRQSDLAKQNKMPTTIDEYNNMASPLIDSQPYDALDLFSEALVPYPKSSILIDGSIKSARTILDWSLSSHSANHFSSAQYGYDVVRNSLVSKEVKDYANRQLDRAIKNQPPVYEADYNTLASKYTLDQPYDLLSLVSEAMVMYPKSENFNTLANKAAGVIMSWSIGSHSRGNYSGAAYGYQVIIDSKYVNDTLKNYATMLIALANKGVYKPLVGKTIVLDAGHNFGGDDGAYGNGFSERELNMQIVQFLKPLLEAQGCNVVLTRNPEDRDTSDMATSLENRVRIANNINPDLFISIHHDSSDSPSASGTSAYYSSYRPNLETKDVYVLVQENTSIRSNGSNGSVIGYAKEGETYTYISEKEGGFVINFNGKQGWISNGVSRAYDPTPSEQARLSKIIAEKITSNIAGLGINNRGVTDRNLYVTRNTTSPSVLVEIGFVSNRDEVNKISQPSFQQKIVSKILDAVISLFTGI